MIKKLLSFIFLLTFLFCFSSIKTEKDTIPVNSKKTFKTKNFEELNSIISNKKLNYKPQTSEFTNEYLKKNYVLDSTTIVDKLKAIAVIADLDESGNYVDIVSPDELISFPVGVKKQIGNLTYTMAISKATITPEYTEVTAFVRILTPQQDTLGNQKQLFFGTDKLKLSHTGGIYGDAKLALLGNVPFKISGGKAILVLNGGFDMKTGNVEDKTYVTVDCSGFKELSINADVIFSRKLLEPVDGQKYEPLKDENAKVTGHFETVVSDWNDILVEISLPPFQLTDENSKDGTGKAGLVFELNTAVFDFSDSRNSNNVNFPD